MDNVVTLNNLQKFATMRDQDVQFEMNGFLFQTTVDKIDEVLPNDLQRYCVNHVLWMLDCHRQDAFDAGEPMHLVHMNNTATIHGHRVEIDVLLLETELPDYMHKGARGTSWTVHNNPNQNEESIKKIDYSRIVQDTTDCS